LRFVYCGRLRALCRPYFLRSTSRGSRVTNPAFFNAGRNSGLAARSARVMPWRMALAWAATPPPHTFTAASYCPRVLVRSNGWFTIMREVSRPK
jgi:hypothetical protein